MKCPHCLVTIHDDGSEADISIHEHFEWFVYYLHCPNCEKVICWLGSAPADDEVANWIMIHPRSIGRAPVPPEVPKMISEDYIEASLVLADSPKASAALSRRCLQHILREKAKVKHGDLAREIQEVISNGSLPSHIAESLDYVRNIGNFATHPNKSLATGAIVAVDPGEAEWSLDVIELLFDFYFVQPEAARRKRAALNEKLGELGKPPMR